jgi:hypothetical protein
VILCCVACALARLVSRNALIYSSDTIMIKGENEGIRRELLFLTNPFENWNL